MESVLLGKNINQLDYMCKYFVEIRDNSLSVYTFLPKALKFKKLYS